MKVGCAQPDNRGGKARDDGVVPVARSDECVAGVAETRDCHIVANGMACMLIAAGLHADCHWLACTGCEGLLIHAC